MLHVNFNTYNNYVTDSLYQWDKNQDLVISGLNLLIAPEIHFANANMDKAIVRQSTLSSNVVTVQIPNSLLQEALTIKAYVGVYEGTTFNVIETIEIPVIAKAKPADYTLEVSDEEVYSFNELDNRISNIIANANSTEGNSELVDIRRDYMGTIHASAGDAVRSQFTKLNDKFQNINNSEKKVNLLKDKTGVTVYNLDELDIEINNHYISASGEILPADGWSVRKITFDSDSYYVNFIADTNISTWGYVYSTNGKALYEINGRMPNIVSGNGLYALLNEPKDLKCVQYIIINHYKTPSPEGYVHECTQDRLKVINMYDNTLGVESLLYGSIIFKIPIIKGFDYYVNQFNGGYGNFYDANNILVSAITCDNETGKLLVPTNANYMKFNSFIYGNNNPVIVYKLPKVVDEIPHYSHYVKRNVDFKDKTLISFGDSVTYGSTPGLETARVTPYPEIFANEFNMILTNRAVAGSYICANGGEGSITAKVLEFTGGKDIIFIAGGINDYNFGKKLGVLGDTETDTFYGCLVTMCEHLRNVAPNSEVYFITPINQSVGPTGKAVNPLNSYRNAIFEVATLYGMNVVDGSKIGFPTIDGNSAFKQLMITDGVHPTEMGHKMYARSLSGIIA